MVYDLYAGLSYCDVIFDVVRNVQTVSAERSSTGGNVYAYVCGCSYVFYAVGSRQAIQYMLYRSVPFTHGRRG